MRIGIVGGTFDPFHRGHLDPVLAVRASMQWDRILFVPAWRQPFKSDRRFASGHHRFAMAVLATEGVGGAYVSPWELDRATTSYTVDTLEHLRKLHPEAMFDWIIGDDNLEKLSEWKSIDRILELANFVVLARGEVELRESDDPDDEMAASCPVPSDRPPNGSIIIAENETVPVSSTEIRRRVRDGEAIDELVDPRVSRYIHHYGLYIEEQT